MALPPDSGATCQMSADKNLFSDIREVKTPQNISMGDGFTLTATMTGTINFKLLVAVRKVKSCMLTDDYYYNGLILPLYPYGCLLCTKFIL